MKFWDHIQKSFLTSTMLFVAILNFDRFYALGSSICSNSFRFDQLCPDPRFGSPEPVRGNSQPDTSIHLNGRRVIGGTYGQTSSVSVIEPSGTSCDFHRNGMETSMVTAVHVTENPWNFRHANTCSHIVKFSYDLSENNGGIGSNPTRSSGSSGSRSGGGVPTTTNRKVCDKEIGIRRYINTEGIDMDIHDEEGMNKVSVYFWHNFTLQSHSAEFVDYITNYHLSKEDISCTLTRQYVQIAVVVSKNSRCEILVQQYKIDRNRSPWGCAGSEYPIPYPIQFCGSYDCSKINTIISSLKLLSRRDYTASHEHSWNSKNHHHPIKPHTSIETIGGEADISDHKQKNNTWHISSTEHKVWYDKEKHHKGADVTTTSYPENGNKHVEDQLPPCVTEPDDGLPITSTTPASDEQGKPVDWREPLFLIAFPFCGCLFILVVLNILKSRNARDICRAYGYPYHPRHSHSNSMYEGSFNSMEKNTLPM